MAEMMKRWNGASWVDVVVVNRIEIGGSGDSFFSFSSVTPLMFDISSLLDIDFGTPVLI